MKTTATKLALAGLLAMGAGSASANQVDFTIWVDDLNADSGSFHITADVSGDNGGLAFYGIELTDTDVVHMQDNLVHEVPHGVDLDGSVAFGTREDALFEGDTVIDMGAGQVTDEERILFGVGQEPGNIEDQLGSLLGTTPDDGNYDAPVRLISGTYQGGLPTIVDHNANVYDEAGSIDQTGVTTTAAIVPEPTSLALLGLGGLALLGRRRARCGQ